METKDRTTKKYLRAMTLGMTLAWHDIEIAKFGGTMLDDDRNVWDRTAAMPESLAFYMFDDDDWASFVEGYNGRLTIYGADLRRLEIPNHASDFVLGQGDD